MLRRQTDNAVLGMVSMFYSIAVFLLKHRRA
jgi:hypothetical protein